MNEPNDVEVNGARIEKGFLDANIAEARGYDWTRVVTSTSGDHAHCIICTVTLDAETISAAYRSKGGYVCSYCHDHFLKK